MPQNLPSPPGRPVEPARLETTAPCVPLTSLLAGQRGALHTCELQDSDRELLRALGLADHASFRLCKAGNPWIVQVQGTRIGIADAVARKILVHVEPS